jgi:hypothetical protein
MSTNLAEVTLLGAVGNIYLSQNNMIGGIQVDTTFDEIYEDELEITEHPVETGAQISDHAYKRNMIYQLRCGWSDSSPSGLLGLASGVLSAVSPVASTVLNVAAGISSLLNSGAGSSGSFVGGAMAASDYVAGIYSQLLQLQQSFKPFSVTSGLRTYDTMLIKSLRVNRDQTKQYVLDVQAVLRQIILVSTQTSTLPTQSAQAFPASSADVIQAGSKQLQKTSPLIASFFKGAPN